MKTGIELITEERERQVSGEGWSIEHDDGHECGELAKNAAELALDGAEMRAVDPGDDWDAWGLCRRHQGDRIRQLTIAGALIAAEIDRLQRKATKPTPTTP